MGRSVRQEMVDLRGIKHWEINFPYMLPRVSFKLGHFGMIVQGLAYQRMVQQ